MTDYKGVSVGSEWRNRHTGKVIRISRIWGVSCEYKDGPAAVTQSVTGFLEHWVRTP